MLYTNLSFVGEDDLNSIFDGGVDGYELDVDDLDDLDDVDQINGYDDFDSVKLYASEFGLGALLAKAVSYAVGRPVKVVLGHYQEYHLDATSGLNLKSILFALRFGDLPPDPMPDWWEAVLRFKWSIEPNWNRLEVYRSAIGLSFQRLPGTHPIVIQTSNPYAVMSLQDEFLCYKQFSLDIDFIPSHLVVSLFQAALTILSHAGITSVDCVVDLRGEFYSDEFEVNFNSDSGDVFGRSLISDFILSISKKIIAQRSEDIEYGVNKVKINFCTDDFLVTVSEFPIFGTIDHISTDIFVSDLVTSGEEVVRNKLNLALSEMDSGVFNAYGKIICGSASPALNEDGSWRIEKLNCGLESSAGYVYRNNIISKEIYDSILGLIDSIMSLNHAEIPSHYDGCYVSYSLNYSDSSFSFKSVFNIRRDEYNFCSNDDLSRVIKRLL